MIGPVLALYVTIIACGPPVAALDTTPVNAPPRVTIVGVVADSTGHPVQGAAIAIDGVSHTSTDGFGSFIVHVLSCCKHTISINATGLVPVELSIEPGTDATRTIDVSLMPMPTKLPAMNVTADDGKRTHAPEIDGFIQRKKGLNGTFLNAADIRKRNWPPLSFLLRGLPGVSVESNLATGYTVRMHGDLLSDCHSIGLYLDGRSLELNNIDRVIDPRKIAAIEVYSSHESTPVRFSASAATCGAIVIWTAHAFANTR